MAIPLPWGGTRATDPSLVPRQVLIQRFNVESSKVDLWVADIINLKAGSTRKCFHLLAHLDLFRPMYNCFNNTLL